MWLLERTARPGKATVVFPALVAATLSLVSGWVAAEPASPSIKVSGTASITTEARASGSDFEVRALLTDEVGRPIASAELRAKASASDGLPTLRRCGATRGDASADATVVTDAAGRACVLLSGVRAAKVDIGFDDARGYYERASSTVQLPDGAADSFELGFDPPLSQISLDLPMQNIGLVARARAGATPPETAELVLALVEAGVERELTRVALDGFGEVHRLSLVSATLGQPGPARLVARLSTRGAGARATASAAVLRTASATLKLAGADDGVEAGSALGIVVTSALGPVPGGAVEARSGGRSIAAAAVQDGRANLALPTLPTSPSNGIVTLEYVGEGPGWVSASPLEVRVRPAGPGYARSALWILAAVLAGLAVVLGWRRPARPRAAPAPAPARARASVELVEPLGANGGYRGAVRDAHDAVPVSPAVVSFVTPGANGRVLLQVRTNGDGAFNTEPASFPEGTLIEVTAPFHATLTAALPAPGVLELSLVSRRRALVERLVRWAERHGKPWIRQGAEPTPSSLASIAAGESEPQVETWARAVEHLAFGAAAPDAAREQAAGVLEEPKTTRERGID